MRNAITIRNLLTIHLERPKNGRLPVRVCAEPAHARTRAGRRSLARSARSGAPDSLRCPSDRSLAPLARCHSAHPPLRQLGGDAPSGRRPHPAGCISGALRFSHSAPPPLRLLGLGDPFRGRLSRAVCISGALRFKRLHAG